MQIPNRFIIFVIQLLPSLALKVCRKIKNCIAPLNSSSQYILNISDYLISNKITKRALLLFPADTWLIAKKQYPLIKYYNPYGLVFSIVRSLNKTGHIVDIVDPQCNFIPSNKYDLIVGHGGHCKKHLDMLADDIKVFEYISGLQSDAFELESRERYDRFYSKHSCTRPSDFYRSVAEHSRGQKYLEERASVLFTINCPRMASSYKNNINKLIYTGLGAYLDPNLDITFEDKQFYDGRRNFIYTGGTGGNIQKGLDLILEAFQKTPHLNLYIYCKVEKEIFENCKELTSPNIHYIYHWRMPFFKKRLKSLLKKINFTIHAPINTGLGTAFSATMGVGLIPVGYIDLFNPGEAAVLCDSWHVDSLVECINRASEKSLDWLMVASTLSKKYYSEHCDPKKVEENLNAMFMNN